MNHRILIIDGNNLAHQLFSLRKNSKVSLAQAQTLADLLSAYLLANPTFRLHIDLYFDGGLAPVKNGTVSLQIIPAHDADDEIIQRVFQGKRDQDHVVVVSGDEDLRNGIDYLGAVTISAFEFILVHNPKAPKFIYPGSLPFDFQITAAEPDPEPVVSVEEFMPEPEPIPADTPQGEVETGLEAEAALAEDAPEEPEAPAESLPIAPVPEEPPAAVKVTPPALSAWYRADPAAWPPAEGAKFLSGAFCPQHRAGAAALLHGAQPLRPADLSALASLLVASCGAEPNFGKQGSLMDRVRLALLKAKGAWLSIEQLAAATDLPLVGLHGKIKKKAEKWVEFTKDAPPEGEAS